MFYNSVGLSGLPIFSLLGCSIKVWICLGPIFSLRMFYNSVGLSGAYFFIADVLSSMDLSGAYFFIADVL